MFFMILAFLLFGGETAAQVEAMYKRVGGPPVRFYKDNQEVYPTDPETTNCKKCNSAFCNSSVTAVYFDEALCIFTHADGQGGCADQHSQQLEKEMLSLREQLDQAIKRLQGSEEDSLYLSGLGCDTYAAGECEEEPIDPIQTSPS